MKTANFLKYHIIYILSEKYSSKRREIKLGCNFFLIIILPPIVTFFPITKDKIIENYFR